MIPYIVTMLISTILAFCAEISNKKNNKKLCIFFIIAAIIPLAGLAGLRTTDLGWDTEKYAVRIFNIADSLSLGKYINYILSSGTEKGFLIVVYLLDKIYGNINFVLFGLQLFVSICFAILAYYYRDKSSITMMFFIYECTLYVVTYNTLRQSLAIGLIFIIIVLMEKKYYKSAFVLFVINLFFHDSAIFSVLVPIIMLISENKRLNPKTKKILFITLVFIFIGFAVSYQSLITILHNYGFISDRYLGYLSDEKYAVENLDIQSTTVAFKTSIILLGGLYFYINKNRNEKAENYKWYTMLIIDYVMMFVSFKIVNIFRVTYYLYYPALFIFIPQCKKVFKNDKFNQAFSVVLILSIFGVFYLNKLLTNYYDLYPYKWIL